MKLSDVVANWIAGLDTHVYGVCGAGAMHLNDSICNHPQIKVLAMHHEQAATFAAEAHARVTNKPGIVMVTAGPGGTNAITGIASAYVDSIPMIIIAGQVTSNTIKPPHMRQLGMNELDLVSMVKGITKYAVTVRDPHAVHEHLAVALHHATSGRPGPVWLEFPLDVQAADVGPNDLGVMLVSQSHEKHWKLNEDAQRCAALLRKAQRPVCIVGNGVRLAGAVDEMAKFVHASLVPVVSSWNASDIVATGNFHYVGRAGVFGDRAANLAIQNADLVVAIGTRLSVPQTGHAGEKFAPRAKKVVVDIDAAEAHKHVGRDDIAIVADAKQFLSAVNRVLAEDVRCGRGAAWDKQCNDWKRRYPVMQAAYRASPQGVNSYFFVEQLAKHMKDDAIVVTDVGAGFISTMQSLPLNGKQRLFHSGGVSSMGYGLPAAIGACIAGNGKQTICLTGDGGIMMNLQELQTIAHHQLPVCIFVFCNNGYMTMQATQENHFKREAISSPTSGLSCPDFEEIGKAFGIPTWSMYDHNDLVGWIEHVASRSHPMLVSLHMPRNQPLVPRVMTRVEDGKLIPGTLEDMYPYLSRDELAANMAMEAV